MDSLKILKTKFAALLCFALASMIILHLLVNDDKHLSPTNQSRHGIKRPADKLFTSSSATDDPSNKVDDALQNLSMDVSDSNEINTVPLYVDLPKYQEQNDFPTEDEGNKESKMSKDKEVQHDIENGDENKEDHSQTNLRDRIQGKRDTVKLLRDEVKPWRDTEMTEQDKRRYKTPTKRDTKLPYRLSKRDNENTPRGKREQPVRRDKVLSKRDKVLSKRDKVLSKRDKVLSKREKKSPPHHYKPLQSLPKSIQQTPFSKPSSPKKINKKRNQQSLRSRKLTHRIMSRKSNKPGVTSKGSNTTSLNFNCPYEGLGIEELTSNMDRATCIPYPRTKEICDKAYEYMEPQESRPIQCDDHTTADGPICVITTLYRYSINDKVKIECNPDNCDGEVLVGCPDKRYGIIRSEKHWQTHDSVESLEAHLPKIIKENSVNGFNFCFLKCGADDKHNQPLIFPPIIKRRKTPKEPGLNINILLEDAVSRPHFYRSLSRTVATLRQLAKNTESGLKVLDFEMMQSYAAFTLNNVRNLFNGRMKLETKTGRESGMNIMMKSFQQKGYQTLIQEDLCFFDTWGSILSENYNQKLQPFSRKFKTFYQKYWNMTSDYIDNRGLTSLACENLRGHGYTNPFSHPTKLCLNGNFISKYMLKYVEDFLRGSDGRKDIAPSIIYTHLNTGHENSGRRIRTDDVSLAQHIKTVSKLSNTITIVLSDHGSKTTDYSITNFYGRLEVFSPIMFMIIPQNVAKLLGKTSIENLVRNQKRLVALVDLHRMLNTIKSRPAVNNYDVSGLLAPIPVNRTCGDIEGLSSDAYCRCKGWNHFVDRSHHTTRWLAEVALGEINNIITQQFTKGRPKTKTTSLGYGACSRFTGQSIEQARQKFEGDYVITTLLFTVVPVFGSNSTERFQVRLNHSSVGEPNVRVINIIRVSVYGKYESCADKNVDIKLCACVSETTGDNARPRINLRDLLLQTHFGLKTSVRALPLSRCLLFGERTLKKMTIHKMQTRLGAFEIANKCSNKSYKLKITGKSRKSSISRKLPFILTIQPRTVVFLFAVDNAWKYGRFKPLVKLMEDSSENDNEDEATEQDNEADFR